jgi:plasmid stabilization system protein ParE
MTDAPRKRGRPSNAAKLARLDIDAQFEQLAAAQTPEARWQLLRGLQGAWESLIEAAYRGEMAALRREDPDPFDRDSRRHEIARDRIVEAISVAGATDQFGIKSVDRACTIARQLDRRAAASFVGVALGARRLSAIRAAELAEFLATGRFPVTSSAED